MNTERRSKTKRGVLVALLLLCFLAIIGSTYAKYTSENSVSASVDIAKWAVKLNNEDITGTTEKTINVNFTVAASDYVAANKIAPSVTATGKIELDLTGTEVGVDVTAVPDISKLSFASADKISTTAKIGDKSTADASKPVEIKVSEIGKKDIDLTVTWTNDETNNADDTASGVAGGTITIPVKVTVSQHIAAAN